MIINLNLKYLFFFFTTLECRWKHPKFGIPVKKLIYCFSKHNAAFVDMPHWSLTNMYYFYYHDNTSLYTFWWNSKRKFVLFCLQLGHRNSSGGNSDLLQWFVQGLWSWCQSSNCETLWALLLTLLEMLPPGLRFCFPLYQWLINPLSRICPWACFCSTSERWPVMLGLVVLSLCPLQENGLHVVGYTG